MDVIFAGHCRWHSVETVSEDEVELANDSEYLCKLVWAHLAQGSQVILIDPGVIEVGTPVQLNGLILHELNYQSAVVFLAQCA